MRPEPDAFAWRGNVPGFDLHEVIGRGGFGVVFRATQLAFGREVAVKVLTSLAGDIDVYERVQQESNALGSVSGHPHIVTVFDVGRTATGRPFIAMEYLSGGPLLPPLSWQDTLTAGIQVAGALESAHRAGVLHRDIKPENILRASYGAPKLADFGIAKLAGGRDTTSGVITASLQHAAPELLDGQRASVASDVYGLSSTLFALISGNAPHVRPGEEGLSALLARIVAHPPPDLRPTGVPDVVCDALEAGLAKAPGERPSSAAELGGLLQQAQERLRLPATQMIVLGSQSPSSAGGQHPADTATATRRRVRALPPTQPEEVPRRRKTPLFLGLAGATLLALLGGGTWALSRPNDPPLPRPSPTPTAVMPDVVMPDVYELTRPEAENALRAALGEVARRNGIDPEEYQRSQLGYQVAYSDGFWDAAKERVWSQYPAPGTPLVLGQKVTIVQWDKAYCDAVPGEHDLRGNWCFEEPPTPRILTAYYDRH